MAKSIIKVLTVTVVYFFFSGASLQIYLLLFYADVLPGIQLSSLSFNVCFVMAYSNSCVCPFIFLIKYEEFRKGVLVVLLRRRNQIGPTSMAMDSGLTAASVVKGPK